MTDPLAAFADEVVSAVAADSDVSEETLRDLLRDQQRLVRDFPDMTVEALVHDWRKAFPEDPLVAQDEVAYYLSVREHVWRDLLARLDLTDETAEALRTANASQFEEAIGAPADREAVVLTK